MKAIVGYTLHVGDLFHYGHLRQLMECKKHCDYLIVGVLTDEAVTSYKPKPISQYSWRAAIYKALKLVDDVVPQLSRDPTENLERLRPDVLFHGDDWDEMPGADWMEAHGGRVVKTPFFSELSGAHIMEIIREGGGAL